MELFYLFLVVLGLVDTFIYVRLRPIRDKLDYWNWIQVYPCTCLLLLFFLLDLFSIHIFVYQLAYIIYHFLGEGSENQNCSWPCLLQILLLFRTQTYARFGICIAEVIIEVYLHHRALVIISSTWVLEFICSSEKILNLN